MISSSACTRTIVVLAPTTVSTTSVATTPIFVPPVTPSPTGSAVTSYRVRDEADRLLALLAPTAEGRDVHVARPRR